MVKSRGAIPFWRKIMGEVKETVKGSGSTRKKKKPATKQTKNLIQEVSDLKDEVSRCIQVKDDDTQSEGDLAKAENIRKSGLMRAVYSLLNSAQALLEEY
jgi:hypothetical protein